MHWKTRPARFALTSAAALLLYLGAVVWAPLIHAQLEVISTASAVGSAHAERGPVVHDDALCQMVSVFQLPTHDTPDISTTNAVNALAGLSHQDPAPPCGSAAVQARAPPR